MKSFITCIFIFLIITQNSMGQTLIGQWDYDDGGMTFEFFSIQENGFGAYQVQYSNGNVYKDYYQLEGQLIGLAKFNNGVDQYFQIIQLDKNKLVLQDQAYNQYVMNKVLSSPTQLHSVERYKVSSTEPISEKNGQVLTNGDYYKNLQLIEFLLNTRLTQSDFEFVKVNLIEEFQEDPTAFVSQTNQAHSQMLQLYQLSDPTQIALAQSAMLAQLYPNLLADPDSQDFLHLLNKYNKILAYDQNNLVAITIQDVDAFISMTHFFNQLRGIDIGFTEQERLNMINDISLNFNSLPLDQKQSLCALDGINDYIQGSYQLMTPYEKEQFIVQVRGQQQASYQNYSPNTNYQQGSSDHLAYLQYQINQSGTLDPLELEAYKSARQTNQNTFTMMQNMMMESHSTSMNIIENIGGGDNYWEVKYNDY